MFDVLARFHDENGACKLLEVLPDGVGSVGVVDCMPRLVPDGQTADYAVVQAARTSYGQGTKKVSEDRGLLRYLLRHHDTTPFEMVRIKFFVRMPIYVYRQFFRHRTNDQCEIEITTNDESARKYLSMNEYSARYSVVQDIAHLPELRVQSKDNKQGGEVRLADVNDALDRELTSSIHAGQVASYALYKDMIDKGVSREVARTVLPVSFTTEFYFTVDLWNLMHFLKLRCDTHAQKEIRVFANCMAWVVKCLFPVSYEAWMDYHFGAVTLSKAEMQIVQTLAEIGMRPNLLEEIKAAASGKLSDREAVELFKKLVGAHVIDPGDHYDDGSVDKTG